MAQATHFRTGDPPESYPCRIKNSRAAYDKLREASNLKKQGMVFAPANGEMIKEAIREEIARAAGKAYSGQVHRFLKRKQVVRQSR